MAERSSPVPTELLDAALVYAARGWPVIPLHSIVDGRCSCNRPDCGSAGKHPRTARGCKDSSTDAATIRRWWSQWPDANVGVCTGATAGISMLGPDGAAGIRDLASLEDQFGYLPDTPTARSGSGGRHLIFRHPGISLKNRKNHLGTSIDARGDGGYFVAAPSANANGAYKWIDSPDDVTVAEMPEWLVEWWTRDKIAPSPPPDDPLPYRPTTGADAYARATAYVAGMPEAIGTGNQRGHDKTFAAARACYSGFALSVEDTYRLLQTHYNPRCVPPWNDGELRHKAQSAADTPSRHPRGYLLGAERADRHAEANGGAADSTATGGSQGTAEAPGFEFVDLSSIKARPVKWAVPGRIPRGTLCLIAGYGGLGKSTITRHLAARITTGRPAFGLTYDPDPPGDVLLVAAEDDYETSVVPHLVAEGRISSAFARSSSCRSTRGTGGPAFT